jgi:RNA polymerase sigma-B factor
VSDTVPRARVACSSAELFGRLPDQRAREELIRLHQPLGEYLARRFSGRGEQIEDLVQVANIGLLNAIDRFDPSRGVQFETYAAATIVGELKRHFRDKAWAVRVPRRLQETGLRMNRVLPQLSQELGRSPTIAEIAHRLELSVEEIVEAMDAMQAYSTTPLDVPFGAEGLTPADTIEHEDDSLEILESWATIAPKVRELPKRERTILYLRFFRGLTQTEIAREVGISQMHVSRLLAQSLSRLRESVHA